VLQSVTAQKDLIEGASEDRTKCLKTKYKV